jgi:hypothetical protein
VLTAFVTIYLNTSTASTDVPFIVFLPLCVPLIVIAARRKRMREAGTWLGFGSILCEERWNHRNPTKRREMLTRAGIGEDHRDYPALMGLTWAELPADRRQLIFDAATAKKPR